jgi:hypothetical protein
LITSAAEFIRLRSSEERDEQFRATHDCAPLSVWEEVIQHHPEMKQWVITNKTVPLEILDVLSHDDDPHVRWQVAMKRKITPAIRARLARDPDETVRHRIAVNQKTDEATLRILKDDPSNFVAVAARARLGLT